MFSSLRQLFSICVVLIFAPVHPLAAHSFFSQHEHAGIPTRLIHLRCSSGCLDQPWLTAPMATLIDASRSQLVRAALTSVLAACDHSNSTSVHAGIRPQERIGDGVCCRYGRCVTMDDV